MRTNLLILSVLVTLFSGCGRDIETPFTSEPGSVGLAPAESKDGQTRFCAPLGDGSYPSENVRITSEKQEKEYALGEGGGCVLRPLREVWAVSHNSLTMTPPNARLQRVTAVAPVAPVLFRFHVDLQAGPKLFAQNWRMDWYHTLKEGERKAPKRVVIQYKKIMGTSYISHWQGAIELIELAPNVTSVAVRNEVNAARTGPKEAADGVREVLAHLRKNAPVWDYLKK